MDLHDIQGIVFYGYSRQPHACYVGLRFGDAAPARDWLRAIAGEVAPARHHGDRDAPRVNVALSYTGLERLGLPPDSLATFPREFRDGMHHPDRCRVNGDVGEDAPERWVMGTGERRLDALLMLFAPSAADLAGLRARHERALAASGVGVVAAIEARIPHDRREHFGFRDGISQPAVTGGPRTPRSGDHAVAPGEVVLGYPNGYGLSTSSPSDRGFDLGRNGTYLVFRKLYQDVAAFWRYAYAAGRPSGVDGVSDAATRLAARMIGRWPDGSPLVLAPNQPQPDLATRNDFLYAALDPRGERCPLGAHMRRANPRDMLGASPAESLEAVARHRIVRRGRLYGPVMAGPHPRDDDGVDRGLVFVALNANLRRQFEFIQQTWLDNRGFGGVYDERDPIVGRDAGDGCFSVPGSTVRRCHGGVPRVVRVQGGGYFFLPGVAALGHLATGAP